MNFDSIPKTNSFLVDVDENPQLNENSSFFLRQVHLNNVRSSQAAVEQ